MMCVLGRRQESDGQVLVLFVLMLIPIFAVLGLGIDGANIFSQQRAAQAVADLSALAGVANLQGGFSTATTAAQTTATNNGYTDGVAGASVSVNTDYMGDPSQLQVIISYPVPTYFIQVIGISTIGVSAQAVAVVNGPPTASPYAVMALTPNAVGAFNEENGSALTVSGGSAGKTGGVLVDSDGTGPPEPGVPGSCVIDEGLCVEVGSSLSASLVNVGSTADYCIPCNPTAQTGISAPDPLCPADAISPPPQVGWPSPWSGGTPSGTCLTPPSVSTICTASAGPYLDVPGPLTLTHILEPGCYQNAVVMDDGLPWTMYPGLYIFKSGGLQIGSRILPTAAATTVTMIPGLYVFEETSAGPSAIDICETLPCTAATQSTLTVPNGTANGAGVLLYFTCAGYSSSNLEPCISGQINDPMFVTGPNSVVNLVSRMYTDTANPGLPSQNMTIWMDRTMKPASQIQLRGGTITASGIIYAPIQAFQGGGCGTVLNLTGEIIVGTASLNDAACGGASMPGQTWSVTYDSTQVASSPGGNALIQ